MFAIWGMAFYVYALSVPGAYENGGPTLFPTDPLGMVGAGLWFLVALLWFWIALRAGVRRLHDRGKNGWWLLLYWAAPNFVSGAAMQGAQMLLIPDMIAEVLLAIAAALFALGLVDLGFLRGQAGENRFGPDPLMRVSD